MPKTYDELWKEANQVRGRFEGEDFPLEDFFEWKRNMIRLVNVVCDLIEKFDQEEKRSR